MQVAIAEWPDTIQLTEAALQSVEQVDSSISTGLHPPSSLAQLFASQHWEAVTARISASDATPQQLLWLGIAHAQVGQFEAAVAPLERVRTVSRDQGEAAYWLAMSYARLVERETADLSRDQAALPILHAVRGEIELRLAGNAAAAATHYKKALALAPGDPALWTGLAAAELSAGEWEDSRRSALRALELDPERVLASRTFAEVCMQERDYEAAIPALNKVLQLEPRDVGAQFLLGTAYSQIGASEKALVLLQAVEDSDFPDEKGRLQYLLGTVLRKLGRLDEAQVAFQRSQELADAFARTSHGLASPAEDLSQD
jgi:Flp pilus assembly protein TadD